MNKFALDYSELQSKLTAKRAYPLAEVKDKIRKVAFDVVQFIDSNHIDELWKIERDGDNEYIVAMYDEDDENKISTSQDRKSTRLNSSHITISYAVFCLKKK